MNPKKIVELWVEVFNRGDADALAEFYSDEAINHQVAEIPVEGKVAIREMFAKEFASAEMVWLVENIFEDGEWAILEWKDLEVAVFFMCRMEKLFFKEVIGTSCHF